MRSQAGRALSLSPKAGPRFGEAEQPQRVSGRRRIKDDMVQPGDLTIEKSDEFIEGRYLDRACAGKLFPNFRLFVRRRRRSHLIQHTGAITFRGIFRVDVHGRKSWNARHWRRSFAQLHIEHFVEVGRRIRADEQDPQSAIGESDSRRAGERRLAHPALPRKEHMRRRGVESAEANHDELSEALRKLVQTVIVGDGIDNDLHHRFSRITGLFQLCCHQIVIHIYNSGLMDATDVIDAMSALAQATRLETFRLLVNREPNGVAAGELARIAEVPQNTMSTHLAILARAGLIRGERQSRSIIYRADLERLREVTLFLLKDCCGGRAEICAPLIADLTPCCPPKEAAHG